MTEQQPRWHKGVASLLFTYGIVSMIRCILKVLQINTEFETNFGMDLLSFIKLPRSNTTLGLSLSTWPDLLLWPTFPKRLVLGTTSKRDDTKSQDFETGTFLVILLPVLFNQNKLELIMHTFVSCFFLFLGIVVRIYQK